MQKKKKKAVFPKYMGHRALPRQILPNLYTGKSASRIVEIRSGVRFDWQTRGYSRNKHK